jgi:hypothetical protein
LIDDGPDKIGLLGYGRRRAIGQAGGAKAASSCRDNDAQKHKKGNDKQNGAKGKTGLRRIAAMGVGVMHAVLMADFTASNYCSAFRSAK